MHRGWHKSAVLDAIVIHSAYRGQGWGTAMLQAALHICQQQGCYKVTLSSNLKRDRTHAFYRRLGFDQHGWSFLLQLQPDSAP
jgi:ribosomal protein S18 acetylase RimI-like enzyme